MTAEFANLTLSVEKTLRYAFRKQAARCQEYVIFLHYLYSKYPKLNGVPNMHEWAFLHSDDWTTPIGKHIESMEICGLNKHDIEKFSLKFRRFLNAKQQFERLNGDYELYR